VKSRIDSRKAREMLDYVWKRLWKVLSNQNDAKPFTHLPKEDRQAIVEILRAMKPDLPKYWIEVGHH
jgi:hypothetical protein